MVAVPATRPLTTQDPLSATLVLLAVHVPPNVASLNTDVPLTQVEVAPVMLIGLETTVTGIVA